MARSQKLGYFQRRLCLLLAALALALSGCGGGGSLAAGGVAHQGPGVGSQAGSLTLRVDFASIQARETVLFASGGQWADVDILYQGSQTPVVSTTRVFPDQPRVTIFNVPLGPLTVVAEFFDASGHSMGTTSVDLDVHAGQVHTVVLAQPSGPPGADAPPTVAITAPTNAQTVSGGVLIQATAADDQGVTQVEFFVDGTPIGLDTAAPYEQAWDSTLVADGNHILLARATDTAAQSADHQITVDVQNAVPRSVERVSVSSPAQGDALSGDSIVVPSAAGRFVAFDSEASNLVPGDTNGVEDIFVVRNVLAP